MRKAKKKTEHAVCRRCASDREDLNKPSGKKKGVGEKGHSSELRGRLWGASKKSRGKKRPRNVVEEGPGGQKTFHSGRRRPQ